MSIERYTCGGGRIPPYEWPSGEWVKHSDHEAALAEAVAKRDDQWATAIAKFTPFDICKKIADEMARGDK
jgi:hypothetical protein